VQVLVEIDIGTWLVTLLVLVPVMYSCIFLPATFTQVELVLCVGAWLLAAFAAMLTLVLQEDTFKMTPRVPTDGRQMLRLFQCTSSGAMRRAVQKDGIYCIDCGLDCDERQFAAPGLAGCVQDPVSTLDMPGVVGHNPSSRMTDNLISSSIYRRLFRLIGFFQAISVTSLVVAYLSQPLEGLTEWVLFALAWLEWPVMLFWIVPVLIRRLTIRNSVESEKDAGLIRKVSLQTKEGLLRDYMRLVQVVGLERRAVQRQEPWASSSKAHWSLPQAREMFEVGLEKFRALPDNDKLEIWKIFEAWDANNNATVDVEEIAQNLNSIGFSSSSHQTAENLLCLVDHDGSHQLSWRKFKAMTMLATANRPTDETQEDLETFFDLIDRNGDSMITIFELAEWSQLVRISMDENDFGNLLFSHFGTVKPTISKAEFGEWIRASLSAHVGR